MNQSPDELLGKLRDVTGPELTPSDPIHTQWIWIALLAILAITLLLIYRFSRLRRILISTRSPRELLMALPGGPTAPALTELDRIIRSHLASTHACSAARLTMPELLTALPNDAATKWATILEATERARFAGGEPAQSLWTDLVHRTAALIQADCEDPADGSEGRSRVK